jgi:hypothetical protein
MSFFCRWELGVRIQSDRLGKTRLSVVEGPERLRPQLHCAGHMKRVESADAKSGPISLG